MKLRAIGAVLISLMACHVGAQQFQPHDDQPTITVNGKAVVNVKPDKIVISLGIETWNTDIAIAKSKNNEVLRQTVAAVRECGVPEKDIQTDHLSIEPRWDDSYRLNFIGYFVRNTLVATLSDAAKVEQLVTAALESGVNYVHGIEFQTSEFKEHREKARELALKAAREKAEKMAAVLGQSIGNPLRINENYSGSPWGYWSSWSGWRGGSGRGGGMSQVNVLADRGSGGEITDSVALGKISIRASVSVTFELKP